MSNRIADAVTKLKNAISVDGKVPNIPKIAIWQTDVGDNGNLIEYIHTPGVLASYVQITSFSVQGDLSGGLTLSKAGAFVPHGMEYTWAVDGNLLLFVKGWNWSPLRRGSSKRTHILSFKLDGASVTRSYWGSFDGDILRDDYRALILSVHQGHLRVAVAEDDFWPVWKPVVNAYGYTIMP